MCSMSECQGSAGQQAGRPGELRQILPSYALVDWLSCSVGSYIFQSMKYLRELRFTKARQKILSPLTTLIQLSFKLTDSRPKFT